MDLIEFECIPLDAPRCGVTKCNRYGRYIHVKYWKQVDICNNNFSWYLNFNIVSVLNILAQFSDTDMAISLRNIYIGITANIPQYVQTLSSLGVQCMEIPLYSWISLYYNQLFLLDFVAFYWVPLYSTGCHWIWLDYCLIHRRRIIPWAPSEPNSLMQWVLNTLAEKKRKKNIWDDGWRQDYLERPNTHQSTCTLGRVTHRLFPFYIFSIQSLEW